MQKFFFLFVVLFTSQKKLFTVTGLRTSHWQPILRKSLHSRGILVENALVFWLANHILLSCWLSFVVRNFLGNSSSQISVVDLVFGGG